jgi:hypothetical protein
VTSLLDRVVGDRGGTSSAPAGAGSPGDPTQAAPSPAIPLLTGGGPVHVPSGGSGAPSAPGPAWSAVPQTPLPTDTAPAVSATGVTPSSEAAGTPTADGGSVRPPVRTAITSTTAALTGLGR